MNTLLEKAKSLGYPNAKLRVVIQFTVENSAICKAWGRDSAPETYPVTRIVDRGVIIGGGNAHEQLMEWPFVKDIF